MIPITQQRQITIMDCDRHILSAGTVVRAQERKAVGMVHSEVIEFVQVKLARRIVDLMFMRLKALDLDSYPLLIRENRFNQICLSRRSDKQVLPAT